MDQKKRILVAMIILILIVGFVTGVDALARKRSQAHSYKNAPAGSIPILVDEELWARILPNDLESLEMVRFVDEEEGKTQEGWLLRDVLLIYLDTSILHTDTEIRISSSSRGKSIELRWDSIDDASNMVMFDLSGRGTLKLVSKMEGLSVRDEWVQDVDQIEVLKR